MAGSREPLPEASSTPGSSLTTDSGDSTCVLPPSSLARRLPEGLAREWSPPPPPAKEPGPGEGRLSLRRESLGTQTRGQGPSEGWSLGGWGLVGVRAGECPGYGSSTEATPILHQAQWKELATGQDTKAQQAAGQGS